VSGKRKVVCVSQARMTSTRLPGKVLMRVAGLSLIEHHLNRLKRARRLDAVVLATTVNATDDPLATAAERIGLPVFRGSETDVLGRFAGAAAMMEADTVVRVTADCPLIDPELIDALVEAHGAGADYLWIDVTRRPRGFDAEVFSRDLLDEADRNATDPHEREHVTPYIYRRPQRFRLGPPLTPRPGEWDRPWRLCVDEPADLELVGRVLNELLPTKPDFTAADIRELLDRRPEWSTINRDVAQKEPI